MTKRVDGRNADDLRKITIERGWSEHAEGSALISFGSTRVLCTASFTAGVPRWKVGKGEGWVTAEYAMLPRATHDRSDREAVKGKVGGRTHEISRLIGRSLRAIIDVKELGENTIVIDCDVLQADGGTRTAAITGAYIALHDAIVGVGGLPVIETHISNVHARESFRHHSYISPAAAGIIVGCGVYGYIVAMQVLANRP